MSRRDDILDSVAAFAAATDGREWDQLEAMTTTDVRAYGAVGRTEVLATMRAHLGGVGATQHLLGNHRVRFDGTDRSTARALTYGRVHHVGAGPMTGRFYECLGEYDDTWVLQDGSWLLSERWFEIRIELGEREVLRP